MKTNIIAFILITLISWNCTKAQDTISLTTYNRELPKSEIREPAVQAQNIILLVGDGMGVSQVSAAFYYQNSISNFHRFPFVGLIRTSAANSRITDSAAGATAFSTGKKSYNGAIGVDIDTVRQPTILEMLQADGYKSALIATSSITHATPASFYAHVKSRGMAEEIALQLSTSNVDFFAGGGNKYFTDRDDEVDLQEEMEKNGYKIKSKELSIKEIKSDQKYGFLLAKDAMPPIGEGRGDFLPDATNLALDYLSASESNFFMMIEGSQIDWGGHANHEAYLVTETLDFDKTIGLVLDFAEKEGNTLVIVTADHETGGFTLSSNDDNYDDIKGTFSTGGHSASLIPVFAYGPGAELFSGIYENTEIFDKMMAALKKSID